MAKTVAMVSNTGIDVDDGTTAYTNICGSYSEESTEAWAQITMHDAGDFTNLFAKVIANSVNGTTTVTHRKNGSDGNLIVSISSSTTGDFEDNTHTDTVADGDEVNHEITAGGSSGTISIEIIRMIFDADTNTVQILSGQVSSNLSADFNYFMGLASRGLSFINEARVQATFHQAGTLRDMFIYIDSNTRSTNTDFRSRVNGSDGNLFISITASTTGVFEDTSNSDTISDGDEVCVEIDWASGSGTLSPNVYSTMFETTTNASIWMISGGQSPNKSADNYLPIFGSTSMEESTEENEKVTIPIADKLLKNLFAYIYKNTSTAFTIYLRINGVNGNNAVSVTSGATGVFEDTTSEDEFETTDDLNYFMDFTSGTAATPSLIKIELEDAAAGGTTLSTAKPTVSAIIG